MIQILAGIMCLIFLTGIAVAIFMYTILRDINKAEREMKERKNK